jgi:uncharacterized RDD family membrane protein YckC
MMRHPVARRVLLYVLLIASAPALAWGQVPTPTPSVEAPDPPRQPPAPQPPPAPPQPQQPQQPQVPDVPAAPEPELGPPADADNRRYWRRPVFRIGGDYMLPAGEEIREAFVLSGNATIEGRVYRDVVVVVGTATIASTAVIEGSLVVVGGSVSVADGARVDRDFVVVGASADAPGTFSPGGQHVIIGPEVLGGRLDALVPWITRGLLWGRLIVPDIAWVWSVVALFFFVHLALLLVFERPVRACATTLSRKPLTALLVGLLVLLLFGPVVLLLTVSLVGIAVIPFLVAALLLAWIVGKIGVSRWIGMSVLPEAEDATPLHSRAHAVRSFVIGFAVLMVAYMVPALGIIAWATVGVTGLGAAVLAFLAGYRKENPAPPPRILETPAPMPGPIVPTSSQPVPAVPYQASSYEGPAFASGHEAAAVSRETPMSDPTPATTTSPYASGSPYVQPVPNDLLAMPHAPFKDRLAAFVLDLIVVAVTVQLLDFGGDGPRVTFLLLLAYHMGFWAAKATTVGGIICQLRIVRITGEPLRFVDALVRALSAIFSLVPLGLGALWILKDPERQAWHDKIAGTYVVKVPRHYPL